jgi:molybdate transport system permease protein
MISAMATAGAREMRRVFERGVLPLLFFAVIACTLGFLALPVVAIFTHVSPEVLVQQLSSQQVRDALLVTVKSSLAAQVAIVVFGTPTAWFLATRRFRGRQLLVTLVELPFVLPPAVAGIALLVAFGRIGLLGSTFSFLGITVAFNTTAVVLAIMFVASPIYVRQAIAAFEAIDQNLVAASRTLGAGPPRTFFRVVLPLAAGGLLAGEALCFARGIGEFGATIMFAGNFPGRTQTLSVAVYEAFDSSFDVALAISALLVIVSVAILLTLKLAIHWRPLRPTSPSLFARSTSS